MIWFAGWHFFCAGITSAYSSEKKRKYREFHKWAGWQGCQGKQTESTACAHRHIESGNDSHNNHNIEIIHTDWFLCCCFFCYFYERSYVPHIRSSNFSFSQRFRTAEHTKQSFEIGTTVTASQNLKLIVIRQFFCFVWNLFWFGNDIFDIHMSLVFAPK